MLPMVGLLLVAANAGASPRISIEQIQKVSIKCGTIIHVQHLPADAAKIVTDHQLAFFPVIEIDSRATAAQRECVTRRFRIFALPMFIIAGDGRDGGSSEQNWRSCLAVRYHAPPFPTLRRRVPGMRSGSRRIAGALGQGAKADLQLPSYEADEDFIESSLQFGTGPLRIYFEHSLSYLTLMSDNESALRDVAARIQPHVALIS